MSAQYACNVAIDLEFTPIPRKARLGELTQEIIEVGAVKMDAAGNVVDEFSHLVRPELARRVSNGVRGLTGIASEDVACARPLASVLESLVEWVGPGRARMVTWSPADRRQIQRECTTKRIGCNLPSRWLDIQFLYPRLMGTDRRPIGLGEAADWCGIGNDRSSAHRALYDAQVTAEVFRMMASGEMETHRKRVAREVSNSGSGTLFASISDRCEGLAALGAALAAKEAMAVCC